LEIKVEKSLKKEKTPPKRDVFSYFITQIAQNCTLSCIFAPKLAKYFSPVGE
jgi:hypothetical protein